MSDKADTDIDNPSGAWPCRPMIRGDWSEVPTQLLKAFQTRSLRHEMMGASPLPHPIARMRILQPSFYPNRLLLEALACYSSRSDGVIRILLGPEGYELLNGKSPLIHAVNRTQLALDGEAARADQYLQFFTFAVRGDEGPFRIVQGTDDLEPFHHIANEARERLDDLLMPVRDLGADDKGFYREATILYGRDLFRARFTIKPSGMVTMEDDERLYGDFLDEPEAYDDVWQVLPAAERLGERVKAQGNPR